MSKFPSQTQDKFTVRFPDGMRDAISKMADEHGRSMNSEIVYILENAIKKYEGASPDAYIVAKNAQQAQDLIRQVVEVYLQNVNPELAALIKSPSDNEDLPKIDFKNVDKE